MLEAIDFVLRALGALSLGLLLFVGLLQLTGRAVIITSTGTGEQFGGITTNPNVMGGAPCIRGLRIPVSTVANMVRAGISREHILEDFPDLTESDICSAVAFIDAAERALRFTQVERLK